MPFHAYTPTASSYCRWYDAADGRSPADQHAPDDETLRLVRQLLRHNDYDITVFYDTEDPFPTDDEFIRWAREPQRLFFVLYQDALPAVITWLSGPTVTGRQSFIHFSSLNTIPAPQATQLSRQHLEFLHTHMRHEQLLGLTPSVYRHVFPFIEALGFQRLTVLRKADKVRGKERDMVLTILDLQDYRA